MALGVEARADGGKRRVRTAERGGGRDGHDRAVGNELRRFGGAEDSRPSHSFPQILRSTAVCRPECAASSAASATASDLIPSSPVAAGAPLPATASWKKRTERS